MNEQVARVCCFSFFSDIEIEFESSGSSCVMIEFPVNL